MIKIDPTGTYLPVAPGDPAALATQVLLADLGLAKSLDEAGLLAESAALAVGEYAIAAFDGARDALDQCTPFWNLHAQIADADHRIRGRLEIDVAIRA